MADGGGIEPLSSFPLFYATGLEDLCGDTTHYIENLNRVKLSLNDAYPLD